MNKKIIGSSAATIVLAGALAFTPTVSDDGSMMNYENYNTEIKCEFYEKNNYTKSLKINVPDDLSIDIATLYVNTAEVDSTLIPTEAEFTSIPIVFEDKENLEIKLYRMGEEVGTARFIDGILKTNAEAVSK